MSGGCEFAWTSDGFGWVLPGAVGVTSVNGDVGPAVLLDAGDIPSTGPSTIQDDIDDLKAITNQAQLEARFPNVAGVHTINGTLEIASPGAGAPLVLDPGHQLVAGVAAAIVSVGAETLITGSVDAALIGGDFALENVAVLNDTSAGLSAVDYDIGSTTRVLALKYVTSRGQRAGFIRNVTLAITVDGLSLQPQAPGAVGFILSGTVNSGLFKGAAAISAGGAPYDAVRGDPTLVIGGGALAFRDVVFVGTATDAMFNFDLAVTLPSPGVLTVQGCHAVGGAAMFRAGSIDDADPRMASGLNVNGGDSRWLGDCSFEDAVTPIILTHAGTWEVMPFENLAAATSLTENVLNQRFTLTRRALQDWGVEGTGRTKEKFGTVSWSATVARSGGGIVRPFAGRIETRPDSVSPWVVVPETTASDIMAGATATTFGTGAPFAWDELTEFRLAVLGNVGTDTAISAYRITPSGG